MSFFLFSLGFWADARRRNAGAVTADLPVRARRQQRQRAVADDRGLHPGRDLPQLDAALPRHIDPEHGQ